MSLKFKWVASVFVSSIIMFAGVAKAEPEAKKMAEETSKKSVPPPTIDTDKDGKPDAWDRNGDGKPDAWDLTGDGMPDVLDDDGDGAPDPAPQSQSSAEPADLTSEMKLQSPK